MRRRWKVAGIFLLASAAAGLLVLPYWLGGGRYLQVLARAIDNADRIVVTEHSCPSDTDVLYRRQKLLETQITYASRELDVDQKRRFKDLVSALEVSGAGTSRAVPACAFTPHHTVTFYMSGEVVSSMLICFQCFEARWNGTAAPPPSSLYGALSEFISSIGLQPGRDWQALAEAQPL